MHRKIVKRKVEILRTMNFLLNGKAVQVSVPSHWTLLRLLRERLGLTGTKEGCGIGECGVCTVLLDGIPVHSCLLLARKVEGKVVETIEGLGSRGSLHPLQQSFIDHTAFQCGFCTPGIIMTVKALLNENPKPTEDEIKQALSGNFCRCIAHYEVLKAVTAVIEGGNHGA